MRNMAWSSLLLAALAASLCNGSTSGEWTCTNTFNFETPPTSCEAVLAKLDRLMDATQTLRTALGDVKQELADGKQAQVDLKDHILQQLDAQNKKLELSLSASGQQQPQRDGTPSNVQLDPKDCKEVLDRGSTRSGVYRISPDGVTKLNVYCEQELDGGGWTVFQRRLDGSVNFYRGWSEYKTGFGDLNGEFWLGNDNIHLLTKQQDQKLKIELRYHTEIKYAHYSHFCIANEDLKYKLNVSGYNGTSPPGDSFTYQNGSNFSTKDRDNDVSSSGNCAQQRTGAWWYRLCCLSNLNGVYGSTGIQTGLMWYYWKGNSVPMTGTRMMVKPIP